jgi:HEAT repeat protein
MRMQAIDLLMKSLDGQETPQAMDPRMVGVLQTLISSEDENPYLRARCQRALELVKASAQVF